MGSMHIGTVHPGASRQREKLLGAKLASQLEDGKETRSEAEGKIVTDFLAGVEIIVEQMS